MKILIAEPDHFSKEALEIASSLGQVDTRRISPAELPHAFETYDVFWCRLGFKITTDLLNLPNRKVQTIVCPVTGLDHIDLESCRALGVKVISLKGEADFLKSVPATAELTIGLTLALLRHIPQASASVRAGTWNRDAFRGSEILGKTVGIVGMGRLGKIVADYFAAFGATVLGFDLREFQQTNVERVQSLDELLRRSDIVTLHVSFDTSTQHLLDEEAVFQMKKGSVLINTARGGVVKSSALLDALESGQVAGAALDVIENEHEPAQSSLVAYAKTHGNLLLTPHIGGNTRESFEKTEVFVAKKLADHLQAEPAHA